MSAIGERFLAHHLAFRPVDGTFMGQRGCDGLLPRADAQAAAQEMHALEELELAVAAAPESCAAERMDKRLAHAELTLAAANLRERPRFANPAWYTGEATFGIIGLLLPQSAPLDTDALRARLHALPDFLADGRARLRASGAAPKHWSERAAREASALAAFLERDLAGAPGNTAAWNGPAGRAVQALREFPAAFDALEERDPAAGAGFLEMVIRDVHAIDCGAEALLESASAAFERLSQELSADAARLTPGHPWQQSIDALAEITPPADGVIAAYRHWHERAVAAAQTAQLLTPATGYGLDYRFLQAPFQSIAPATYFLFYRSPPALAAGSGSVYWVMPPAQDLQAYLRAQNVAVLKTTHTVHHGSIGHHTQNARARAAPGILARVGGTDCASGIAFSSAGTMVEGWACYAEDLLRETGDFYAGAELLLLKQNERRNAASVMVDVNLHLGRWSIEEAARFYREKAGFAAHRAIPETVRNSMFPGSRLMYWSGVEAIKALRRASPLGAREFHDSLLSFGHVPIAAAGAEMARANSSA
jgi:Bacterial protein of unknown function (DUF885)